MDGITCTVFISTMEAIERVVFADPKDIEDGTIPVEYGDVVANLPYHRNASIWFDHHDKAESTYDAKVGVKGRRGRSPSAARLVYEYYDSPRLKKYEELLDENDRIDSAYLTLEDVLDPKDWVLLSYTVDPFMGLDAFHGYANSIIAAVKHGLTIDQIMDMAEVRGRVNRYYMDTDDFKLELQKVTRLDGNVLITDFRQVELMPIGNRFIAFAIFPQKNVQVRISHHVEKSKVSVRLGKSIFNRTCNIHLGRLAAQYGGGGLDGAAGCLLDPGEADARIAEIVGRLKEETS
ncbi:MAG TPA: hypothetical protein ENL08_04195 [Bacteroidetes bacterium]|nr:hypothetical protein [Bacteroidota bacterium]